MGFGHSGYLREWLGDPAGHNICGQIPLIQLVLKQHYPTRMGDCY
jgi:hypothetical protein